MRRDVVAEGRGKTLTFQHLIHQLYAIARTALQDTTNWSCGHKHN